MSHPAPIPCAHCGTNFMRRDLDPDAPKLCNNCIIKDQQRNPKGVIKMEKVKLLIEVDRATQVEVEELCTNQGISISDYFVRMHRCTQGQIFCSIARSENDEMPEDVKKFHHKFESISNEPEEAPVMVRQKKSRGGKK